MRNMRNPFVYSRVVGEEAFCNRQQELADLTRAMENSEKLFLYSERRFGKTSLVKLALEKLPQKQFRTAYVDLWPTDGEASFVAATARSIAQSMGNTPQKLLAGAMKFFRRLAPSVTLDEEGKPELSFGIEASAEPAPALEDVLKAPAKLAATGKRRSVIVFDEFQQILEYETDMVERRLRSVIQNQRNVSYLFLGSKKHLIQKMFLDQARPLYRAAGHYPLGPIAEEHWLPFIRQRFQDTGKRISQEQVHKLCRLTQGHPFYTQHLGYLLWENCAKGGAVREDALDSALSLLLERESYAYATLWDSLTTNQKRLVRGLAAETESVQPFSADFVRRHGLGSPSSAQRAMKALLKRGVIDRDNGSLIIADRFFRIWITRLQG